MVLHLYVSKNGELPMTSIGLYNSLASTNTALAKNNDQIANLNNVEAANDVSKEKTSAVGAGENLVLSSRSQKLNAISNEFFSQGNFTQIDSTALIERVHEYGLMNDDEYEQLTSNSLFQSADTGEEPYNLIDHLENIKGKLSDTDEHKALSDGITGAITILSDVETAKLSPTFKQDISHAISQLSELSNDELYDTLENEEQQTIQSSATSLSIIDRISPQRLSNPFVNRYLDFAQ